MLQSRQEDTNVDAGTAEGEDHEESGVETRSDWLDSNTTSLPASHRRTRIRESPLGSSRGNQGPPGCPLSFLASILRSSHQSTLHITTSNVLCPLQSQL